MVWSGLQLSVEATHRFGTPHKEPKTCTVEARIKNYIIHRQQTDLYLGLPYTEDIGQINLNNVTYKIYKYPKMYKTKSNPSNINMRSPIATITIPNFISLGVSRR